jgi:hypothetical protein
VRLTLMTPASLPGAVAAAGWYAEVSTGKRDTTFSPAKLDASDPWS